MILCEVDRTNIVTLCHDEIVCVSLRQTDEWVGQDRKSPSFLLISNTGFTENSKYLYHLHGQTLITSASRRIADHLGYVVVVSSVLIIGNQGTLIYGAPPSQCIHM